VNGAWRPRDYPSGSGPGATLKVLSLQPPKKKSKKKNQRRGIEFKVEYLKWFGLKVNARDAARLKYPAPAAIFVFVAVVRRKRNSLWLETGPTRLQQRLSKPSITDSFVQHLTLQHSSKWKEFSALA
jgi:hypothetical protein